MYKTHEIIAELNRELALRQKLYPRWVEQGRFTQSTADHRMQLIREAIAVIEKTAEQQQTLF